MFVYAFRANEAQQTASKMLGHRLYTKQTGREGKPVSKLMVCEKLFTRREYYFACNENTPIFPSDEILFSVDLVVLDRAFNGPVIITSTQGGGNIEEIAAENPDAIIRHPVDVTIGLQRPDVQSIAERLGFRDGALGEVNCSSFLLNSQSMKFIVRFFSRPLIQY